MRHIIFIIAITINLNCSNKSGNKMLPDFPIKSGIKEIMLKDDLGSLYLEVPNRYDTFYSFGYDEGCGLGTTKVLYKYQPKQLGIFKESGMINPSEPKKKNQILISHHRVDLPDDSSHSNFLIDYHAGMKRDFMQSPFKEGLKEELIRKSLLGTQSNFVFVYDETARKIIRREIVCSFLKGDNLIVVKYLYVNDKSDPISKDFIEEAKKSIKSLALSNGQ